MHIINQHSSSAFDWSRKIKPNEKGEVTWRVVKPIKGVDLAIGELFVADAIAPSLGDVNLAELIGKSITRSPAVSTHSMQGITFDGDHLIIDPKMCWDPRMLYVAITRVRRPDQLFFVNNIPVKTKRMQESEDHLRFKIKAAAFKHPVEYDYIVEERPTAEGKFVPDLSLMKDGILVWAYEIVHTSPPSTEKLEWDAANGIGCTQVSTKLESYEDEDEDEDEDGEEEDDEDDGVWW